MTIEELYYLYGKCGYYVDMDLTKREGKIVLMKEMMK